MLEVRSTPRFKSNCFGNSCNRNVGIEIKARFSILQQQKRCFHQLQELCPAVWGPEEDLFRPRSNIIFILTDDQDVTLGGLTPLVQTKKHFAENGVFFENSFTAVPVCCPSRASIFTGQYQHHHKVINNSLSGNCYGESWRNSSEKYTFVKHLHDNNYTTFFAGKYMNQYGHTPSKFQVPPGWTIWNGLVGNSVYYDYKLSVDGREEKFGNTSKDYLTDLINDKAIDFLKSNWTKSEQPFFMMLSTPACHAPFTASNKYLNRFSNIKAPRTPNFEMNGGSDKHWLLRQTPSKMSENAIKTLDSIYGQRWATLLSVDDLLFNVLNALKDEELINNTYLFFSSDNGYHLGQFSLPWDKRQIYEFDIRVPLMVSGPGVIPGSVRKEAVVNVDLAPTFLEIAGIANGKDGIDGISLVPLLKRQSKTSDWRSNFLVEYNGETSEHEIEGCPQYGNNSGLSNCFPDCICEDSWNNSYTCLRTLNNRKNTITCVFHDNEKFVEIYDLEKDPNQLFNIAKQYVLKYLTLNSNQLTRQPNSEGP